MCKAAAGYVQRKIANTWNLEHEEVDHTDKERLTDIISLDRPAYTFLMETHGWFKDW